MNMPRILQWRPQAVLRLLAGSSLALGIVGTGLVLHPVGPENFPGHVLNGVFALLAGLMVALPSLDEAPDSEPARAQASRQATEAEGPARPRFLSNDPRDPLSPAELKAFTAAHPVCFLATTEHGAPRVRTVVLWFADDHGLHFILRADSGTCAQLGADPRAEVCFYNRADNLHAAQQMRVRGKMRPLRGGSLQKKAARAHRSWPPSRGPAAQDPRLVVYRLRAEEVHFWTMRPASSPRQEPVPGRPADGATVARPGAEDLRPGRLAPSDNPLQSDHPHPSEIR